MFRLLLIGALAVGLSSVARAAPDELTEGWYQVELLIFVRDDALTSVDEQWEPLPSLSYPDTYTHLVVPDLATRRMTETDAYASAIDERGLQTLTVPRGSKPVDNSVRPDALINEPYIDPETELEGLAEGELYDVPPLLAAPDAELAEPDALEPEAEQEPPEFETIALVRPEMAVPRDSLEFRAQARTLRRRGQRVLFHESWWSRLEEDGPATQLVLDRGSDTDADAWPELQGSVRLYRSRYLHIDVDVWLNTMAPYFIEGWQIQEPPLPIETLAGETLNGERVNPWEPVVIEPLVYPTNELLEPEGGAALDAPLNADGVPQDMSEAEVDESAYPWKHAIRHVQSRRMRSTEVHYLDHPVIGVIVRIMPADAERLPLADDEDVAFRELHQMPVEKLDLPLDWATDDQ